MKMLDVIANDTGDKIKWRGENGKISTEWIVLSKGNILVMIHTYSKEQWAAVQRAVKKSGVWIMATEE